MKSAVREFRMLLLVTMTAATACAPSVGEVGGESESSAIVAGGADKKFQAIVPVFYDQDGKYRSLAPAANKDIYSYICLYRIEWSDASSKITQTYKTTSEELLTKRGPLEIGTFEKRGGGSPSTASISRGQALILAGKTDYGATLEILESSRPKRPAAPSQVQAAAGTSPETVAASLVTKSEFKNAIDEVRYQDAEQGNWGFPCHNTLPPFNGLKQRNEYFGRLSAAKPVPKSNVTPTRSNP